MCRGGVPMRRAALLCGAVLLSALAVHAQGFRTGRPNISRTALSVLELLRGGPTASQTASGTLSVTLHPSDTVQNFLPGGATMVGNSWTGNASSTLPTATANATTAPDGTATATQLTYNTAVPGGSYSLWQRCLTDAAALPSSTYTFSIAVKSGSMSNVGVLIGNGSTVNGQQCTVSGSWSRCSVSISSALSSVCVYIGGSGGTTVSTGTVYVADGRLEAASVTSPLVVVRSTPRFCEKSDGGVGVVAANAPCVEPKGLSVEPASTNYLRSSLTLINGTWASSTSGAANTATANSSAAPDGTNTATMLTYNTAVPPGGYSNWQASSTTIGGAGSYTYSVYLKAGTLSAINIYLSGSTTALQTAHPCVLTSSWTRCSRTVTLAAGETITTYLGAAGGAYGSVGAGTLYAWCAQLEPGTQATSCIDSDADATPNSRSADAVYVLGVPYNGATGTVEWTYAPAQTSMSGRALVASRNVSGATPGFAVYASSTAQLIAHSTDASGSASITSSVLSAWAAGTSRTMRYGWNGASAQLYVNGALVAWGTTKSPLGHNRLWLLTKEDSTSAASGWGWIHSVRVRRAPPPTLTRAVAIGDSITEGSLVSVPFPAKVQSTENVGVVNAGVSGNTTTQMLSRWRSTYQGQGYRYLILLGGTNDIGGGINSATTISNLSTISDEALADGMDVYLLKVTPCGACSTPVSAINTGLASYASGKPRVHLLESYTALNDSGNPGYLLGAYSLDGLHPNQAGTDILAGLIASAL